MGLRLNRFQFEDREYSAEVILQIKKDSGRGYDTADGEEERETVWHQQQTKTSCRDRICKRKNLITKYTHTLYSMVKVVLSVVEQWPVEVQVNKHVSMVGKSK